MLILRKSGAIIKSMEEPKGETIKTPQQLNAEFKAIFTNFPHRLTSPVKFVDPRFPFDKPPVDNLTTEQRREKLTKRMSSEHPNILKKKIDEMLDLVRITDPLKNRIRGVAVTLSLLGINTSDSKEMKVLLFFLDYDDSSSGGIFEKETAKKHEVTGCQQATRQLLRFMNSSTDEEEIQRRQEQLDLWRQQFRERYDDDLSSYL